MLLRRNAVPEAYRRAIRLAIGLAIPCVLGLGVLGKELPRKHEFMQACLWCAITVAVVNAPLLGKAARTGMERCLGTILGGLTGYLVFQIGEWFWNEQTDGIVLTVGASCVAIVSVLGGQRFKLDASARLFVITYLLVIFGADRGTDAAYLAWNRVCGILLGVFLILLLSIIVLPKSASMECIRDIETALKGLKELNSLAWSSYILGTDEFDKIPGSKSLRNLQGLAMYRGKIPRIEEEEEQERKGDIEAQPLLHDGTSERARVDAARAAAEDALEDRVEKTITSVYQACFKLEENMKLADAEWYIGSRGGRPVFVPDLPLCLSRPTAMPIRELAEVGACIRRTARLFTQLITTLGYGFRSELREMLGDAFPDDLMRALGLNCQAVTTEMARAWEASPAVTPAALVAFVSSVSSLVATSDRQRRQIIHALKKHRAARPGRLGWDRLMDALAKEQRPAATTMATGEGTNGITGERIGGDLLPPRVLSAPAKLSPFMRALQVSEPDGRKATGIFGSSSTGSVNGRGQSVITGRPPLPEGSRPTSAEGETPPMQFQLSLPSIKTNAEQQQKKKATDDEEGLATPLLESQDQPIEGVPGTSAETVSPMRQQQQPTMSGRLSVGPSSVGTDSSVIKRSALRAAALAEASPGLAALLGPVSGLSEEQRGPTARQLAALGSASSADGRLHLHLFPETPDGRVAQVRWYSFQFLLEELTEEISALQHALNDCLAKLPQ